MKIGFSTGCFYYIFPKPVSLESFRIYSENKIDSIELLIKSESILNEIYGYPSNTFSKFTRLSLHAPVYLIYKKNKETRELLDKILNIVRKFKIELVVVHADIIEDWTIFAEYPEITFAIENMDNRKKTGKYPQDLLPILINPQLKFVLDLQHVYVNDKTMKLAEDFLLNFKDQLCEIHISGFNPEKNHYLLFREKQEVIIDSLRKVLGFKDVPIIIESPVDSLEDINKELEYIKI